MGLDSVGAWKNTRAVHAFGNDSGGLFPISRPKNGFLGRIWGLGCFCLPCRRLPPTSVDLDLRPFNFFILGFLFGGFVLVVVLALYFFWIIGIWKGQPGLRVDRQRPRLRFHQPSSSCWCDSSFRLPICSAFLTICASIC